MSFLNQAPSRRNILLGGIGLAALALAGCAKDVRPLADGSASPTDSPNGSPSTSPSSSDSASASASSSASGSTRIIPEDEYLKDSDKYLGPLKYEYKELSNKYVEATDTSPAKNVPTPVIDQTARRTNTLEGAYKTLCAYQSSYVYLMRTGTIEYAINLMNKDDTKLSAELLNVHTLYSRGGWVKGYENKMSILSEYRTRAYASTELSAVSFPCEDWASEFTTYQNGSSQVQEASTIQVPVILVFDQGKWNVTSAEFFRSEYSERFKKIFAGSGGSSSSSSGGSYSGTGV